MTRISKKGVCIALLIVLAISPLTVFADLITSNGEFVDFYKNKDDEEPGGRVRITEQNSVYDNGWYYVTNMGGSYVRAVSVSVVSPTATPVPTADPAATPAPTATAAATATLRPGVTPSPTPLAGVVIPDYKGEIVTFTVPASGLMLYDKVKGKQVENAKAGTKLTLTQENPKPVLDIDGVTPLLDGSGNPVMTEEWYSLYYNGKTYYVPPSALIVVEDTAQAAGSVVSVLIGPAGADYYSKVTITPAAAGSPRRVEVDTSSTLGGTLEPNKRYNAKYYSANDRDVLIYMVGSTPYYFSSSYIVAGSGSTATVAGNDETNMVTKITFTLEEDDTIKLYREKSTASSSYYTLRNTSTSATPKEYTLYGAKLDDNWYRVTYESEIFYLYKPDVLAKQSPTADVTITDVADNQGAATETFWVTIGASGGRIYSKNNANINSDKPVKTLSPGQNVLVGQRVGNFYPYTENFVTYYLYYQDVADATSKPTVSSYKVTIYDAVPLYNSTADSSARTKDPTEITDTSLTNTGTGYVVQKINDDWYSVIYDGVTYYVKTAHLQAAFNANPQGVPAPGARVEKTIRVPEGKTTWIYDSGHTSGVQINGPASIKVYDFDPVADALNIPAGLSSTGWAYISAASASLTYDGPSGPGTVTVSQFFFLRGDYLDGITVTADANTENFEPIANVTDGKDYVITIGLTGAQLYKDDKLSEVVPGVYLRPGEVVNARKHTGHVYIVNGYYVSVKDIASIKGGDDAASAGSTASQESVAEVAKGQVDTTFKSTIISYTIPASGLWLYYDESIAKPAMILDAGKTIQLNEHPTIPGVYTVWYGGTQYYVSSATLSVETKNTVVGGTYSIVLTQDVQLYSKYVANPTNNYLENPVSNKTLKTGDRVNVSIQRYVDNTKTQVLVYKYVDATGTYYFYGKNNQGTGSVQVYSDTDIFAALVSSQENASLMTKIAVTSPDSINIYTTPSTKSGYYTETDIVLYGVKHNDYWYKVIYNGKVFYVSSNAAGADFSEQVVVAAAGISSTTYTVVIGPNGAKLYTLPATNATITTAYSAIGQQNLAPVSPLPAGKTVLASKVGDTAWYAYTDAGVTYYFQNNAVANTNTNASVSSYVVDLTAANYPATNPIKLYATISSETSSAILTDLPQGTYTLRRVNNEWSSIFYQGKTFYIKNSQIPADALQTSTPIATTSVNKFYKVTLGASMAGGSVDVFSDSTLTQKIGTLAGGTTLTGKKLYVANANTAKSPDGLVFQIEYTGGIKAFVSASNVVGVLEGDEVDEAKLAEQETTQTGTPGVGQTVMHRIAAGEALYSEMNLNSKTTQNGFEQVYQLTKVDESWYSINFFDETWYYPAAAVSAEKSESGGTQVVVEVGESYTYTFTESATLFAEPNTSSRVIAMISAASAETHSIHRISDDWYDLTYNGLLCYVRAEDIFLPFIPNAPTLPQNQQQNQHDGTGYITPYLLITPTSGTVNLRKTASTSSTILERISYGIQVKNNGYVVDARGEVWYSVTYNGKTGYVLGDYVTPVGTAETGSGGNPANDIGRPLTVNMNEVNVRSGAGMNFSILGRLQKGQQVIPLDYHNGTDGMVWYSFKLSATQTAYIRYDYLAGSAASSEQSGNVAVKSGGTNLRAGPGESFSVIEKLNRDDIVTIIGTGTDSLNNEWYYVTYEGKAGYLRSDLVRPLTDSERSGLQQNIIGSYIDLKYGSTGPEVLALQKQLILLGHLAAGKDDGKYGTETTDAVKAFQKAKGMTQTGVASAAVQAALFNTPQVTTGSTRSLDWFATGFTLINGNKNITVYDINVGITWNARYIEGANHADVIPASKADADKLKAYNITGSYVRRPVIVTIGGQNYAGSMYAVGHGDKSFCSYFHGVMCIHFTGSKTHGSGNVDKDHQAAIQTALNYANTQK